MAQVTGKLDIYIYMYIYHIKYIFIIFIYYMSADNIDVMLLLKLVDIYILHILYWHGYNFIYKTHTGYFVTSHGKPEWTFWPNTLLSTSDFCLFKFCVEKILYFTKFKY